MISLEDAGVVGGRGVQAEVPRVIHFIHVGGWVLEVFPEVICL